MGNPTQCLNCEIRPAALCRDCWNALAADLDRIADRTPSEDGNSLEADVERWFLLHRLREACGKDLRKLRGIIEVDETFVGGKERNKHKSKRQHLGRGGIGKAVVIGMRERGKAGRVKAMPIADISEDTVKNAIYRNVEPGSTVHTDEAPAYGNMGGLFYQHAAINHGLGVFSVNGVTTNGIESVFAVLKRGILGVYHHTSEKHLGRYVDEFAFRLNDGNVARHTIARLDSMVAATTGKRLTYKGLIQ
jgi:transposase-like protein